MAVTKNQECTVTIEGYSGEGAGVARIDGFVVFVSGALRGEVCRILILKVLTSAAFAKVLDSDSVKKAFAAQGLERGTDTAPAYLAKFIGSEVDRWSSVVKKSGVTLD